MDLLEKSIPWKVIFFGVLASLFIPFAVSTDLYFPFVSLKGVLLYAVIEIIFFTWIFLFLKKKEFRPKVNLLTVAFLLFIVIMALSSLFGIDPSRSFWSKHERMTGLLMWLHLFGLFLVLSSSFKKSDIWKTIFLSSSIVATITGFLAVVGHGMTTYFARDGATLGNSSFLGHYLIFNVFFSLWFFLRNRKSISGIYGIISALFMIFVLYKVGARAAFLASLFGIALIPIYYMAFAMKKRGIRITGKSILALIGILFLVGFVFIFVDGSFINEKFIDLTTNARVINWRIAVQAFLERPLLGHGPETYTVFFSNYFDPCLFTPECGQEIWFDRSHNIIFDNLSMMGILGLFSYLMMIFFSLKLLLKNYKKGRIAFATFAIFSSAILAYFLQNMTVFDMPMSLLMFTLVLGFISFIDGGKEIKMSLKKNGEVIVSVGIVILFTLAFTSYVINPYRSSKTSIESVKQNNLERRMELQKKTLEISPMGKYQIRDFFAVDLDQKTKENISVIQSDPKVKEVMIKYFDFLTGELEKSIKESPQDFRIVLRQANLYNIYYILDQSVLDQAFYYSNLAVELSPQNQQGYWALSQTNLLNSNADKALEIATKALDLDRTLPMAYRVVVQIANGTGKVDLAKQVAQEALSARPNMEFDQQSKAYFEQILNYEK